MKTRFITGAILTFVIAAVVILGKIFTGYMIFDIAISAVTAVGIWEMLHNTGFIKSKCVTVVGMIYSVYTVLTFGQLNSIIASYRATVTIALAVFLFAYCMFDRRHSSAVEPMIAFSMSVVISYAFGSLLELILQDSEKGIFYFILCIVYSWITDIGAYLVGKNFGKHKLCPDLSPKKTVEGAIGGIVFCIVVTALFAIIFNLISNQYQANTLVLMLLSIPLSIIGMLGDLQFSYIKRHQGIKDYGVLLPGHGGILDRFDSMLAVAPLMLVFTKFIELVK